MRRVCLHCGKRIGPPKQRKFCSKKCAHKGWLARHPGYATRKQQAYYRKNQEECRAYQAAYRKKPEVISKRLAKRKTPGVCPCGKKSRQTYCSQKCRSRGARVRQKMARFVNLPKPPPCPCGAPCPLMEGKVTYRKYCSEKCQDWFAKKAWLDRHPEKKAEYASKAKLKPSWYRKNKEKAKQHQKESYRTGSYGQWRKRNRHKLNENQRRYTGSKRRKQMEEDAALLSILLGAKTDAPSTTSKEQSQKRAPKS